MKNNYVAPKLSSFGNVTEMTQAIGRLQRRDFVFDTSGNQIGNNNDLGSQNAVHNP